LVESLKSGDLQDTRPLKPDAEKVRSILRRYEMASFLIDWDGFLNRFPVFY
jgi:hypothetical protein